MSGAGCMGAQSQGRVATSRLFTLILGLGALGVSDTCLCPSAEDEAWPALGGHPVRGSRNRPFWESKAQSEHLRLSLQVHPAPCQPGPQKQGVLGSLLLPLRGQGAGRKKKKGIQKELPSWLLTALVGCVKCVKNDKE